MFEGLGKWVQNLSYYMIFITILTQIIPNQSYKKYVKFFCGLILVLMLVEPVARIMDTGAEGKFERMYEDCIEEIFATGEE